MGSVGSGSGSDAGPPPAQSVSEVGGLPPPEPWLATLVESFREGLIATGPDGRVRLINPAAQTLTGWKRDDALGRPVDEVFRVFDLETRQPLECPGITALRERRSVRLAYSAALVARDGSALPIDDSATPIQANDGSVLGGVIRFRDRTLQATIDAARAQLATIIESSDDAIFREDLQGKIASWNDGAKRMFGYAPEDVLGRSSEILLPPERHSELATYHEAAARGERPDHLEATCLRKDGSAVEVSLAFSPIRNQLGHVVGISSIARDITTRKRAEEQLRKSERRYRLLFDTMMPGVVFQDSDGKIVDLNPAAERILGTSAVELKGQTSVDREPYCIRADGSPFPGTEHPSMVALRTGKIVRNVLMGVQDPNDHQIRWIEITAVPIVPIGGDRPTQVCTIFEDITERKQAEDALHAREEQLRMALESARMVAWDRDILAEHLTILVTDPSIFGFDPGTYPMEEMLRSIHPDDRQRVDREIDLAQETGIPFSNEFRVVRRDGSVRWAAARGRFIYDQAGQATRSLGVTMDISDRKRSEISLALYAERLRELSGRLMQVQEAERRSLARELHDEIGQALTAVKINLQGGQLEPDSLTERLTESISIVDETLQRIRGMALDLRPSLLDDLGLVTTLQWYVERHAKRTGLEGRFVAEPHDIRLPPEVETACFRLAQEALTNIARHARASGYSVELSKGDRGLELIIRDNGCGFDSTEALQRAARGSSLGLLGMIERAELVGGKLTLNSTPGKGTEVRVSFPDLSLARRSVAGSDSDP